MLIEMKSCRWESWGSRDQNDHPPRMHLESLITPVQDEPLFRIIMIFWVSLLNPIVMFFCCFCFFFAEELVSRAEYWRMSPTSTLHLQKNVLAAGGREGGGAKKMQPNYAVDTQTECDRNPLGEWAADRNKEANRRPLRSTFFLSLTPRIHKQNVS